MRVFGLIGLLLALVIVGLLVKKQLTGVAAPVLPAGTSAAGSAPAGDARAQSQQIQQQIKPSLDAAVQARPLPDDN
ncbi:hypothetical protein [Variovorax saccharolyticus]|uniref:hypothetical protein n=1 Tax=Variovorax saccharolyticus TaxID=3053516 RepID=UPI0025790E57|nr:hypothetical protein [Variovorax sp. J22R187]MDM0017077.1 hypothetical protein [Variovorax sp. J22R187]